MTDKAAWQGQVGTSWAAEWQRTDRSFTGLTELLVARAGAHRFAGVVDIGCGAGELSLALGRGHPQARIVGVDVSEDLVAVATRRGENLSNVSFELADAAAWDRPGFRPDLLVSRHGVMFFDDPVAAFARLHDIAAPGAGLLFSCFRSPAENPWASETVALLPPGVAAPSDPHAPGPFAFAAAARVERILADSGWHGIAIEPVDFAFVVGTGEDPVEDAMAYFAVIGPVARAAAALAAEDKAAFRARLRHYLADHASGSILALRAAAWIVTAHR